MTTWEEATGRPSPEQVTYTQDEARFWHVNAHEELGKRTELLDATTKTLDRWKECLDKIRLALETASKYGQIDGDHHKAWVIDQMVRKLTGERYDEWVRNYEDDDYHWDTGIAP